MEKFRIDTSTGIVYLRDIHSAAEFEATLEAFVHHPDYRMGMGIIGDRRGLNAPDSNHIMVFLEIIRRYKTQMGDYRWALVTSDNANFGMARVSSARAGFAGISVEAFRSMEEAQEWVLSGKNAE